MIDFNEDKFFFEVRCYTCGKLLSGKEKIFSQLMNKYKNYGKCMDLIGVKKICCRRMILGSTDAEFENLKYSEMNEMKAPNNDSMYFSSEKTERCPVHIELSTNRITNKRIPFKVYQSETDQNEKRASKKKKFNDESPFHKNSETSNNTYSYMYNEKQPYTNPFLSMPSNQSVNQYPYNTEDTQTIDSPYSPVAPTL